MTKFTKFVIMGLSVAVLLCLLYSLTLSVKENVSTRDTGQTGPKDTVVTACSPQGTPPSEVYAAGKNGSGQSSPAGDPRASQSVSHIPVKPSAATSTSAPRRPPKPSPAPYSVLYMLQTEQCLPAYYRLNDVFGSKNLGFEVIVLSFRKECLDESILWPHLQYLVNTSSTWTTGRNLLFEAAMQRKKTYLYYVFMDDDFAMGDPRQFPVGPWRRFEDSLRSLEPAVAAIDIGWLNTIRDFHVSRRCSGETAEFIGTVWFDAICNAFHYKAVRHILPYDPTFDEQTWWASQMSVIIRSEVLFRGQVVIHTELFGDNSQHRPYPRDFNFSPDMIRHMTKDLETLVPEGSAACANATIQQWRTVDQPLQHGSNSPTLCLPPPFYHDTIAPARYACM